MPLSKILLDIATETGIAVTNDNEKAWVIDKINDIAEEMYATQDITGCLREMTINIDADDDGPVYSSLVALPYYVDQLRGLRFSVILGGKIPMETMQPRYSLGHGWQNNPYSLPFRIVRDNAPLKRDISNASVLTFTIAEPQTADITLSVVGKTTNASRAQETVTLVAGDITVSTTGNFEDVETISKNRCVVLILPLRTWMVMFSRRFPIANSVRCISGWNSGMQMRPSVPRLPS